MRSVLVKGVSLSAHACFHTLSPSPWFLRHRYSSRDPGFAPRCLQLLGVTLVWAAFGCEYWLCLVQLVQLMYFFKPGSFLLMLLVRAGDTLKGGTSCKA